MEKKYDLNDRTENFAAAVIHHVDRMPNTVAGKHMGGQLLRSGTSPALNYGEALSAESKKDFIHKMRIANKELKETRANLNVQRKADMVPADDSFQKLCKECEELIRIFSKSIATARKNLALEK